MAKKKSYQLTEEDVEILRQMRQWQRNLNLAGNGVTFVNTPDGARAHINPGDIVQQGQPHPQFLINITSTLAFGQYKAKTIAGPLNANSTGGLAGTDYGTPATDEDCIFWNICETGTSFNALDLTQDSQSYALVSYFGVFDQATGLPIFVGNVIPWENCGSLGGG